MPKMKGGELIAEYLVQEKVPYVFGICGHGNVGILDALYDVRDKVQLISPRHEQCAGHMADAYFRVKHQPVATLTSTGPGSANMVMSLATALSDSSAFLAITANVPTSQANRAPFQELYKHNQSDFPSVLRPVVKRSFQPTRVDMLPLALRQSFDTMVTGRPGPVNLDIPYNVFQEEAEVTVPAPSHRFGSHRPGACDQDLAAARRGAAVLAVMIIVRPGVDPATQAGGAEVVGSVAIHAGGFAFGEVWRIERRFGGRQAAGHDHGGKRQQEPEEDESRAGSNIHGGGLGGK